MASAVSLLTLRTRVRELADCGPDTATVGARYNNTRLNAIINDSWQRAREIACEAGNGLLYLTQSSPSTMTAGAINSNSAFGSIPFPTTAVAVYGIDYVFNAGDVRSLEFVPWNQRNDFLDNLYGTVTGPPVGFSVVNIGTESGSLVSAGTIAIFPAPDKAYSYVLWYLPPWTPISNDTDVVNGIAGHQEWAVNDAAMKILLADGDSQNAVGGIRAERDKSEALLTARAMSVQRVGPGRRRPVRELTRQRRFYDFRRPM